MLVWLWAIFFVVCNIMGVEILKAALTLPLDEAVVPRVLSLPAIALTAFAARRVLSAWKSSR